ncbi:MAG: acyclic terpene utilization AtuA family protein [Planctomycetota bacterium]
MKFHRSVSDPAGFDPGLPAAVDSLGECVVQLDYRWPGCWPVDGAVKRYGRDDYARGLITATRALIKPFFLGTGLRVISDGGGWGGVACVEAVAATLREGGCGDVLVSWVAGGDLLAAAEEAIGSEADSGVLPGLPDSAVVSARAQLGAGPIAKALSEGAQVVITSRHDAAAPLQAAAAVYHGWGWEEVEALVGASLAARFVGTHCAGEVIADGSLLLPLSAEDLRLRLPHGVVPGADFDADFIGLDLQPAPGGACRISGAKPADVHGRWPAAVERVSGYVASPVLVQPTDDATENLAEDLKQVLAGQTDATVEVRLIAGKENTAVVFCRSNEAEHCRAFAAAVASLGAQAGASGYDVVGPWPSVFRESSVEWASVPRDSVSVSIDTRPASEWY